MKIATADVWYDYLDYKYLRLVGHTGRLSCRKHDFDMFVEPLTDEDAVTIWLLTHNPLTDITAYIVDEDGLL